MRFPSSGLILPWARPAVAALVFLSIAGTPLAGCAKTPPAGAAGCAEYQYSANSIVNPDPTHAGPFKLVLVLIDLYSNAPDVAGKITQDVAPYLQDAVAEGAYVKVEADGGTGTPVTTSSCFDGSQPFLVTRVNQVAQQKD